MSSSDDDLLYTGPSPEYKPPIGKGRIARRSSANIHSGYYDKNLLLKLLADIQKETKEAIEAAEQSLQGFSLKVPQETRLDEAHREEWPTELGDVPDYISYNEYKALGLKDTRSSNYIRKIYEDYLRGPSGTKSIDVLGLAKAIQHEATNMGEFVDTYIRDVNDTSEHRTLELLQDWAENAHFHSRLLRSFQEKGAQEAEQISASEMDSIDSANAAQYQALFKVRLNSLNNEIARIQEDVKKQWIDHSDPFYKKFMGPALKMRLNATRDQRRAVHETALGAEIQDISMQIDTGLTISMADQMKRNQLFDKKMNQAHTFLQAREKYNGYISQLGTKGKPVPNPFTNVSIPINQSDWFKDFTEAETATQRFKSSHAGLAELDDDEAHPQYLLKSGGTVTGDIAFKELTDKNGLKYFPKIDGIVPHTHAHTGNDGTNKIHGSNIVGGTLSADAPNLDDTPLTPTNLRIIDQKFVVVPPGTVSVEAIIAWDGDTGMSHEIQITRLT